MWEWRVGPDFSLQLSYNLFDLRRQHWLLRHRNGDLRNPDFTSKTFLLLFYV